jgi:hypothetical protein
MGSADPDVAQVGTVLFVSSLMGAAAPYAEVPPNALAANANKAAQAALSTRAQLQQAATRAAQTLGPGKGPVYGTYVHSEFETQVKALGDPNLSSEVSYLNGVRVSRGTPGSVRLDVVEGPLAKPTAAYDLKTGSATLTPARVTQIQQHVPGGNSVPVEEVKP